ncbi:MAG: NUDIX domain-containing protein [Ardenticatenaceae bacterium]|nr:NUDIX domain-containing protein [Anaerolineales bacterium]MCB8923533.1 NUDIX domain-containing protein [Ardenticatenaceae bacterium]MCB8991896.1 NUDIX domain-containing protein [Ardenticatenaceae bacterium]MCB9003742.1 NUDIX domain-containing protein [Ardenticatenaceae bacterium]
MMRQRVTLIFLRGEEMLLLYRNKHGHIYYVTPGGGVEPGETIVQAAMREGKEETSLDFTLGPLLWEREFDLGYETAFLITDFSGRLALGGPEQEAHSPQNIYRLEWHPLAQVNDLLHYPGPVDVDAILWSANGVGNKKQETKNGKR